MLALGQLLGAEQEHRDEEVGRNDDVQQQVEHVDEQDEPKAPGHVDGAIAEQGVRRLQVPHQGPGHGHASWNRDVFPRRHSRETAGHRLHKQLSILIQMICHHSRTPIIIDERKRKLAKFAEALIMTYPRRQGGVDQECRLPLAGG